MSKWARETIADSSNVIFVSAASIWEIAIKASVGKVKVPEDFVDALDQEGFHTLSIGPQHAWAVGALPIGDHKDPFDRQLVAQALIEELPIISRDAALDVYGVKRRW